MVSGCVMTEDCPLSVSAERVWKVAFSGAGADGHSALRKACAGFIDAVDVNGDGGPGSVTTMTLSPAVAAGFGGAATMKSRVVSRDAAAMAIRTEVLEGGRVSGLLKSQVAEVRLVEDAADAGCVAKLTVEYERIDGGGALSAEDQASLASGYLGLLKKVEAYLVAHPEE
ncbi:major allergen Api g 1, isoallergen 1 [Brachypodium distachyon]|uniref:Bet v I/Major latex protein domain-containing protein n=1 Tax=Brachypodium distachyon TaxID=15368 RepID=I1IHM4_BRADI|nr:major allergen Api g 1, isoallergen 1 [Brachypodium distachyon]KQJ86379.1 hypothetical protein BRADI_4g05040v3 [Brachypodium distachyon]|eukprot:XP_003575486.1 major allergen Api g 1, isoallergen 1 [Brachypodium distachyon]